jgi:hypothetical protein
MTDRVHSLTVVLDADVRDDDVAPLIDAIRMMRGVADVRALVSDPVSHMAEMRARRDAAQRVLALYKELIG